MRMGRLIVGLLGLGLLLPSLALAGSYTITTTPEQDEALARHLQSYQGVRTMPQTPAAYLRQLVDERIEHLLNAQGEAATGVKGWSRRTPAERAELCRALKMKTCPGGPQ